MFLNIVKFDLSITHSYGLLETYYYKLMIHIYIKRIIKYKIINYYKNGLQKISKTIHNIYKILTSSF